jgi:lipopolysaccharide transport system ATP-binding protein
MSDTVIHVENLSKKYILGKAGGSDGLRHVIHDFVTAPLRWLKKPASAKNGDSRGNGKKSPEEFWALKNVSFDIKQGEVVGIIGRNGAGKSTLLKVLSRITEQTKGRVEITGRVSSLLEVGTGFHPELTGRENIYLNGAILGMSRQEIKAKFDEIVAFAEVEKFLETPVKRYSSGMYVRLAFAVAAHLEPEILIVDEVLAVGDAQFQKKCLGKMQDVSRCGRTILFVSHNMAVITQLTNKAVFLKNGEVAYQGPTDMAVQMYVEAGNSGSGTFFDVENSPRQWIGTGEAKFISLRFDRPTPMFFYEEDFSYLAKIKVFENFERLRFSMTIYTAEGVPVGGSFSSDHPGMKRGETAEVLLTLPKPQLAPGHYYCAIGVGKGDYKTGHIDYDVVQDTLHFEVCPQEGSDGTAAIWTRGWGSVIFQELRQGQPTKV